MSKAKTGEGMREKVIDLIGENAFRAMAEAGIAMVDANDYRSFMAKTAEEMQRIREVCIASAAAQGHTTVRAELREENGTTHCIVTHPEGDEVAAVNYLGHLLRGVVAASYGKAAEGAYYEVSPLPAAYVPGPKFPHHGDPGSSNTTCATGILVYGEEDDVGISGIEEGDGFRVRVPRRTILVIAIGDSDDSGVMVNMVRGENGWVSSIQCLGPDGDAPIPWPVHVKNAGSGGPRVHVECPTGTPLAWVIR